MKRIKLQSGDEYDCLTGWRKYLKSFDRAGVTKKIKRQYNKRFRKAGRLETHDEE